MKNYHIISLTCGFALFVASATCAGGARFCDDETAKLVTSAYVLSLPLFGQDKVLEQLINANRPVFSEDGAATRCMRTLGSALIQQSIKKHQGSNPYAAQETFGGVMPEGLEHLPGQVDNAMRNAGTEYITMGQELLWLAQVLPTALQGDAGPYNEQGTQWRQMVISVLPQVSLLCSMDASVCQIFLASTKSMVPIIEQEVYMLATGRY